MASLPNRSTTPTVRNLRCVRPRDDRAVPSTLRLLEEIAAQRLDWRGLCLWIDAHLVAPGYLSHPSMVRESSDRRALRFPTTGPRPDGAALRQMLGTARRSVVECLRRLAAPTCDDHFLLEAIHMGRVTRVSIDHQPLWRPRLAANCTLSDWIVSYLAADVLSHREEYERALALCEGCDHPVLRGPSAVEHECLPREMTACG